MNLGQERADSVLHFQVGEDELHLWRVGLLNHAEELVGLASLLSADELQRSNRFAMADLKRRYVVTRAALRQIVGRYLDLGAKEIRFEYGRHGKPSLAMSPMSATRPDLRFSVSHSGELALIALTLGREVGVDLEQLDREIRFESIARRFFTGAEVKALQGLPPEKRRSGFFLCWTRKEAVLKARGEGLAVSLDSFTVSLIPGEPARLMAADWDQLQPEEWTLCDLAIGSGVTAAAACQGPVAKIVNKTWTPGIRR